MQLGTTPETPESPAEDWKPSPGIRAFVTVIWIVLAMALFFWAGTISNALTTAYAPGWPVWVCLLVSMVVTLLYFCFFFLGAGPKLEYAVVCIILSFLLSGMINMGVGARQMRKHRFEEKAQLGGLKKGEVPAPIKAEARH